MKDANSRRRRPILAAIVLAFLLLPSCGGTSTDQGQVNVNGGQYWDIATGQLSEMLQDKDFLLVNVHVPYDGEIPETDLFLPHDKMEENLSSLPEDRDTKTVLYCRSGSMSATAAETLVAMEFTGVYNLGGGIRTWQEAGCQIFSRALERGLFACGQHETRRRSGRVLPLPDCLLAPQGTLVTDRARPWVYPSKQSAGSQIQGAPQRQTVPREVCR